MIRHRVVAVLLRHRLYFRLRIFSHASMKTWGSHFALFSTALTRGLLQFFTILSQVFPSFSSSIEMRTNSEYNAWS